MFNFLLLLLSIGALALFSLFILRIGKEAAAMWLGLLAICMNLFVLKQVTIMKLHVTASEALVVGYLLTLNLIQEYYGRKFAQLCVRLTFLFMLAFCLLTQLHLAYKGEPNHEVFTPLPRLFIASLISFFAIQFVDISFFAYLREKFSGRLLTMRTTITLLLSQLLDTILFTFIGLWGIVHNPFHVILFSFLVKGLIILFNAPFIAFSKRVIHV